VSRFCTAFLDRDGTLNVKAPEGSYVTTPGDVRLLAGVATAVRRLNDARIFVVLVTNQRGIGRGLFTQADYEAVISALVGQLAQGGARLDAVYACPHENDSCDCRKPLPGMLLQAARDHPAIDLARSVMVGDAEADVAAGAAAGTATVRIAGPDVASRADLVVPDLPAAVSWILGPVTPRLG